MAESFSKRLLSNFGFLPTPPKIKPFKEQGVSGTAIHSGYVQVKDQAPEWNGIQKYRTASEIVTNISIVAASVHYFLNLISHPKWTATPSDPMDSEAVRLAKFVESVLHDMHTPWPNVIRRAAMFRFYGFGVQEWIAKRRSDGLTGFFDIEPRPQHTIEQWDVTPHGSVQAVWQRSPQTGEVLGIPRGKIIYIVEDTLTDSPEGLGVFRHLLEPYKRLKQYLELETRGFERDLRGTPIGRAPITLINEAVKTGELTEAEGSALIEGLKDFVKLQVKSSDTGIVLDSMPYESEAVDGRKVANALQWGLDLLSGNGAGLMELAQAIERIQREMARIIGTEMLLMGDKTGNRALSNDKSKNLYLVSNAVLSQISSALQKDLVDVLWVLNGFPEDKKPKLTTEDVAFKSVQEVTSALRDMAMAGVPLAFDDPAINDVRDMLGISRVDLMTAVEDAALRTAIQNPIMEVGETEDEDDSVDDEQEDEVADE